MAGALRAYGLQLYGFVVKTYTLRWRTPVATAMEVLLPFIFMLLLSVCYWTTPSTLVPEQHFDTETLPSAPFNNTEFAKYYFCTHPRSTMKLPWTPCNTSAPLHCLSNVGGGSDLCLSMEGYAMMSQLSIPMRYAKNAIVIDSLDGYLAVSAFFTETTREEQPTFFGRTVRASMSHYGKLLVASESAALAGTFMSYCRNNSAMCGEVLHPSAFASHADAVAYATEHENTVWAIVHLPADALNVSLPRSEYTISMNYSATPATFTSTVKSFFTHELDQGASSSDYTLYHGSGFAALQLFVHDFYMANMARSLRPVDANASAFAPRFVNRYGLRILPMPVPAHIDNDFLTRWTYYLPLIAMIAALFPVARLTGLIVEEKAHGIREAMMIMGMHRSCHFAGWYATAVCIDLVAALLATMIMKVGFLGNTQYGVLLGVYFTFLQQNSAMCFLISTIFSNPRIASWCAALTVFLLAMPFYSFPDGMSVGGKLACALFPGVGYAEAFELMTNYAKYNTAFTYATANQGEYCVNRIVGVMWASFVLMSVMALYLDRVAPAAVGVAEHPLFFLTTPLCWLRRCCCGGDDDDDKNKKGVSRHRRIAMSDDVYLTEAQHLQRRHSRPAGPGHATTTTTTYEPASERDDAARQRQRQERQQLQRVRAHLQQRTQFIEHYDDEVDVADPSIAAVVHRLRKVYIGGGVVGFFYTLFTGLLRKGDRVAALDGVTFAMRTGEVSVLLGPNGAGKTTMIGALCGMLTPTSGDVYIRGHRTATHLSACRRDIGYCPQNNIVWPELTVEEHVTFYARLKAARVADTHAAVRSTLELVNLTDKRHCRAAQLSGGQRRRLCLAMALVGDPAVLLLDEPTAGMDMKGRQVMYEVLRRARAHRSVLLSTHLLDEADRVGDRVLLLHRGRLAAEGSSMFLKSQMRVGYVVTCVLDSSLGEAAEDAAVNALIAYVHDKGYSGHRELDAGALQALPPRCSMHGIERRGREVSFRFDLSLLTSSGRRLLAGLEADREELHLRTVGLSLATLTDVFSTVTEGRLPLTPHGGNAHADKAADKDDDDDGKEEQQQRAATTTTTTTTRQCPYSAHGGDGGNSGAGGGGDHHATGGRYYYQARPLAHNNNNNNNNNNETKDNVVAADAEEYSTLQTYAMEPTAPTMTPAATTRTTTTTAMAAPAATTGQVYEGEVLYEADNGGLVAFARQLRALLIKRMHFARRDVKLMVFQVALPVIFLLLSMLVSLARAPTQPPLLLDMTMYSDYARNPAEVHAFAALNFVNPLSLNATTPRDALGEHMLLNVTAGYAATAYKGKALPDAAKQMMQLYSATLSNHTRPHYFGLMPGAMFMVAGPPTARATVLHNMTYSHAVPQGIDALFNLAAHQIYGSAAPHVITRNAPLHFGEYERQLYETSKPVLMGMFIILPFILIPSQTISYIVRENECGARHMQWLSGVSVLAYWLSCFLFDAACYLGTEVLTFCVLAIFGRGEYVGADSLAPSLVLFLLFGMSSIPLSYALSFFFKSPFAAQTAVLVVNFAFGFLWVTMESMLAPHALDFVRVVTYIVRTLPAVAFGEGVYILSGNALGRMLSPVPYTPQYWDFVQFQPDGRFTGGIGTAIVYMACVLVGSTLLLVVLEYLRIQNAARYVASACCCCYASSSAARGSKDADDDDDESNTTQAQGRRRHSRSVGDNNNNNDDDDDNVREEEARVCGAGAGGPSSDLIAMQHVCKQYWMTRSPALDDVSLGVRRGEVVSLLGLNGAGKSTALSILAGEVAATGGEAYVNGVSVLRPAGRVFVGYCPQYDALLDRLTPREHLWLYARLRGVREACIAREVDVLLQELGLHPHRHQPACALSGGNKRRLSLAIALVGRTTSVLLDEPTAGMDAQARAQMCAIVRQLTRTKSVLLTTHLIDEVDALADRVAFLSRGRLRCIGTPQELKSRSSERKMLQVAACPSQEQQQGETSGGHHAHTAATMRVCGSCYYVHVLFPRSVQLLRDKADGRAASADDYVGVLRQHAAAVMRRRSEEEQAEAATVRLSDDDLCSVSDVRMSSLTLQVRGRLTDVCSLVADLHQGAVRGLPPVSYVGVTQPGLEDVLLED